MNPTAALRPSPSKTLAAGGTAHQLAGASIAENTWRAYSGALRRLEGVAGRSAAQRSAPSRLPRPPV